jgi:putative peptidoglycan lipid II flippase
MRSTLADGIRQIFFMLLPASAFLLVLGEPVVRLVFERGAFDELSTSLTTTALLYFSIGLAFNGASLLVLRAFFSMQMPMVATKVAAVGVVLNLVLDAALYQPLGVGGIPLATSIASIVTFLMLVWLLERELGGLHRAWILDGVARSLVASGVSVLFAWSVWSIIDGALGRGPAAQLLSMAAALAASAAGYLAAAQAFEMRELQLLSRLRRPLQ